MCESRRPACRVLRAPLFSAVQAERSPGAAKASSRLTLVCGVMVLLGLTVPLSAASRPRAHFTWHMAERAQLGFKAYQRTRHVYDPSYVNPRGWIVVFDACERKNDKFVPTPIVSYTWEITKPDIGYSRKFTTKHCRVQAVRNLPSHSPRWRPQRRPTRRRHSEWRPEAGASRGFLLARGDKGAGQVLPLVPKQAGATRLAKNKPIPGVLRPNQIRRPGKVSPVPPRVPPPGPPAHSFEFIDQLPALGAYHVSLTVKNKLGQTDTKRQTVYLRDYLIVVIGDSYAAGQGDPDRIGRTKYAGTICNTTKIAKFLLEHFGHSSDHAHFKMAIAEKWLDPLAWRSYHSGHAHAAIVLEHADPHSSVTLLDFATSGAKIENLVSIPQMEFQKDKCFRFHACGQIGEVKAAIGHRHVDAVLMSIGGNDVGFAPVLVKALDDPLRDSRVAHQTQAALQSLEAKYRGLNHALQALVAKHGLITRQPWPGAQSGAIYITGYPIDPFSNRRGETHSGCGIFDTGIIGKKLLYLDGVSHDDAVIMRGFGEELNRQVENAARKFGWHFVPLGDGFRTHGYCAGKRSYLRFAEDSCRFQGDLEGTMHPNEHGYGLISARLVRALKQHTFRKPSPGVVKSRLRMRH
jgi:lysophospholipase L1-like esterase